MRRRIEVGIYEVEAGGWDVLLWKEDKGQHFETLDEVMAYVKRLVSFHDGLRKPRE